MSERAPRPSPSPDTVAVLVDNHRRFLAFLEARVGSKALAEDLLQDAFVRALDRGGELRREESAVAWFFRMLRNAVTDHYRRTGSRDRRLDALKQELERAEQAPEWQAAVCQCVESLARTLKPEYEDILRHVEVDGQSVKDYAKARSISPNHAGVRIFRARAALKARVERSCGTCAEHGCLDCSCEGAPRMSGAPV